MFFPVWLASHGAMIADKGRSACAGQDDPQIVLAQQRRQEAVDR
jgi:hypothetical protein